MKKKSCSSSTNQIQSNPQNKRTEFPFENQLKKKIKIKRKEYSYAE